MKNKYLFFIVLGCWMFGAISCESWLEESPQNKLKPATTDDYDQLLNKAYPSSQIMPYLDILSDDVDLIASDHVMDGPDSGDEMLSAYMWEDSHEVSIKSKDQAFTKFYETVFYTNVVLGNIGQAAGMELDEAKVRITRNNIRGEAYALRAYAYFYLVNLYAKAYDPSTAATDAGIPLTTSTSAEDKAYRRNTVQEIYSLMEDDLKKAVQLMEDNPMKKAAKYKFDAVSARALLARVYLYMQKWDAAIKCASKVISEKPVIFNLHEAGKTMTLENNTNASQGTDYLDRTNDNVLFVSGNNELLPALSMNPNFTTFSVNKELGNIYESEDVRRVYFMFTSTQNTSVGVRIKLSYGKNRVIALMYPMGGPSYGYTRVIRTEEMYLILAEAYAHQADGMDKAVEYLNRLRVEKFREGKYVPLKVADFSQQSLLEFVWLERRKELCFEGHRWFDLRRTTRPAMERLGYDNEKAVLLKDDPKYVLQIPQRELDVNPAIGMTPR